MSHHTPHHKLPHPSPNQPDHRTDKTLLARHEVFKGGPIPDSIKKSYVQQQLPVRNQSLAAFNTPPRNLNNNGLTRAHTHSPTPIPITITKASYRATSFHPRSKPPSSPPPPMPKSPIRLPSFTIDPSPNEPKDELTIKPKSPIPTTIPSIGLTVSRQNSSHSSISSTGGGEDDDDDDEEFNFRDRPPSSIICSLPIFDLDGVVPESPVIELPHEDDNEDENLWIGEAQQSALFETTDLKGPLDPVSGPAFECLVEDPEEMDDTLSWKVPSPIFPPSDWYQRGSLGGISPSRSESSLSLSEPFRRMSTDTELSDSIDSFPLPSDGQSSMFLRMQEKQEEQRRSIYAYRTQKPLVIYPAMLSRVAREMYRRIHTTHLIKDDITYHHVFSGTEAVDCLLHIIRTKDRNVAILVGRALGSQGFFHNALSKNGLRDLADEIYQFRDSRAISEDSDYLDRDEQLLDNAPNGVFTVLTECYSPTCSRDQPCYSMSCPRTSKTVLKRTQSQASIQEKEVSRLWVHSVDKETFDATSSEERKRQELIFELIYTEEDFVKDLRYIQNSWVKPLIKEDIIPDKDRENFVQEVFWNLSDIEKVNGPFADALTNLQKEKPVVGDIGDVLLTHVCQFDPFVVYGSHQVIGKFYFELEKKRNPTFLQFVQETERKPESRRLELNGYLTKPTTRLGRYNLLLREILKRTPDGSPDKETIPQVMEIIKRFLGQVNSETGKVENRFDLEQISERLAFKSVADKVDLKLLDENRRVAMKGRMKRKGNSTSDASDLQLFLFDHYLVLAKIKMEDHLEHYIVHIKPIPLELLSISLVGGRAKRASSLLPYSRSGTINPQNAIPLKSASADTRAKSGGYGITFYHHGRKGSSPITLYLTGATARKMWATAIREQQQILASRRQVFRVVPIVPRYFMSHNRVHNSLELSTVPNTQFSRRLLVGTDQGVYYAQIGQKDELDGVNDEKVNEGDQVATNIIKVIGLEKVSHVEVITESHILVLAEKTLWMFPYDVLLSDTVVSLKRGRVIGQNVAFFHVGQCMGKTLVCVVKTNKLSPTTIRVLEPMVAEENKKSRSAFLIKRLVARSSVDEGLKHFKDLYRPSEAYSISLLKTKMCIACPLEIDVVDMNTFGVQTLLDPEDEELGFVFSKTDARPLAMYRIQMAEYLVCYNTFAFFVDQKGRMKTKKGRITWEGIPDKFALCYPYILAFEADFIEIRNIETGQLEQLIRGTHIRLTSSNTDSEKGIIQGSMDDPDTEGYQLMFQLEPLESLPKLPDF
ncbi:CNH domain-containing protein [Phycomyces nitens]|nr:CNH domain-containing protein [Phycomyces nitens]